MCVCDPSGQDRLELRIQKLSRPPQALVRAASESLLSTMVDPDATGARQSRTTPAALGIH